jgi:hypothetical protein
LDVISWAFIIATGAATDGYLDSLFLQLATIANTLNTTTIFFIYKNVKVIPIA